MQERLGQAPMAHLLIASGLTGAAFLLCQIFQLFDPIAAGPDGRPRMHWVFLPHGVFVLLAWIYGWAMVPLVLPAFLVAAAFVVGPEHMTPTVAWLVVLRMVLVMAAFELLRALGRGGRWDHGRAGLVGLMAAGVLSSAVFSLMRVAYAPCCDGMPPVERAMAYVTAFGADMAGLLLVMLGAMFLFRALRH